MPHNSVLFDQSRPLTISEHVEIPYTMEQLQRTKLPTTQRNNGGILTATENDEYISARSTSIKPYHVGHLKCNNNNNNNSKVNNPYPLAVAKDVTNSPVLDDETAQSTDTRDGDTAITDNTNVKLSVITVRHNLDQSNSTEYKCVTVTDKINQSRDNASHINTNALDLYDDGHVNTGYVSSSSDNLSSGSDRSDRSDSLSFHKGSDIDISQSTFTLNSTDRVRKSGNQEVLDIHNNRDISGSVPSLGAVSHTGLLQSAKSEFPLWTKTNLIVQLRRQKLNDLIEHGSQEDKDRKVRFASSEAVASAGAESSFSSNSDKKKSKKKGKFWKISHNILSSLTGASSLPNLSAGELASLQNLDESANSQGSLGSVDSTESLSYRKGREAKTIRAKTLNKTAAAMDVYEKSRGMTPARQREEDREREDRENEDTEEFGEDAVYLESHATSLPLPIGHRETSYSLVRGHAKDAGRTTVSFTRIPSFRCRLVRAELLCHFTTFVDVEGEEGHKLKDATDIFALENGDVIVTDMLSNKMVLFDREGNSKVTFTVESGSEPWGACVTPDLCMAVTLRRQGCVALWAASGEPLVEFGQATLHAPSGIRCDSHGHYIITDEGSNGVFIFNRLGKFLMELTGNSQSPPRAASCPTDPDSFTPTTTSSLTYFNQPRYVCVSKGGNYIVADSANHCVKTFSPDGRPLSWLGEYGRKDGQLKFPYGVAVDGDDNILVADHYNNRVSLFTQDGEFLEHLLTSQDEIARPKGLAVWQNLLFVTHGQLRANKVSVFRLNKTHERRVLHKKFN